MLPHLIMTQPDKIRNLKDYFAQVRKRPGMYLGTISISKLHDHLQGYQMAYWFNDIDNQLDKNFFDNFTQYVYSYYGVTTNDNWKGVILEQCFGNEQTALDTFFDVFDMFIENAKVIDTKKIILDLFDKLIAQDGNLKSKLGANYSVVLTDTVDLIKENALSTLKYDYDGIYEQLKEKSEEIPELNIILTELEKLHTT